MELLARLFRKDVFTLEQRIRREAGACVISQVGNWERKHDRLVLRLGEQEAEFEPLGTSEPKGFRKVIGFSAYQSDEDLSLENIELRIRLRRSDD